MPIPQKSQHVPPKKGSPVHDWGACTRKPSSPQLPTQPSHPTPQIPIWQASPNNWGPTLQPTEPKEPLPVSWWQAPTHRPRGAAEVGQICPSGTRGTQNLDGCNVNGFTVMTDPYVSIEYCHFGCRDHCQAKCHLIRGKIYIINKHPHKTFWSFDFLETFLITSNYLLWGNAVLSLQWSV